MEEIAGKLTLIPGAAALLLIFVSGEVIFAKIIKTLDDKIQNRVLRFAVLLAITIVIFSVIFIGGLALKG